MKYYFRTYLDKITKTKIGQLATTDHKFNQSESETLLIEFEENTLNDAIKMARIFAFKCYECNELLVLTNNNERTIKND